MSLFDLVKSFSVDEKWGEPERMNGLLVILIEKIKQAYIERVDSAAVFNIHCGYETSGHVSNSQHDQPAKNGQGAEIGRMSNATDFSIRTFLSFSQQVNVMQTLLKELQVDNVVGLGIYPDWNNKGFHLDVRGNRARWGRIGEKYVSLETALEHAKNKENGGINV